LDSCWLLLPCCFEALMYLLICLHINRFAFSSFLSFFGDCLILLRLLYCACTNLLSEDVKDVGYVIVSRILIYRGI
jgi:hypothetical protein